MTDILDIMIDQVRADRDHEVSSVVRHLTIAADVAEHGLAVRDYWTLAVTRVRTDWTPEAVAKCVKSYETATSRAKRVLKAFDGDLADALAWYAAQGGKLGINRVVGMLYGKADDLACTVQVTDDVQADAEQGAEAEVPAESTNALIDVVLAHLPNLSADELTLVMSQCDILRSMAASKVEGKAAVVRVAVAA